jgi:SAM-dependent methyltransferase
MTDPRPSKIKAPAGDEMEGKNKRDRWWGRLSRRRSRKPKLSRRNLDRLCRENATDKRTLVVHSEDVDHAPYFPNAFTVTKRPDQPADLHVDLFYRGLDQIPSESFEVILCTGLLEHVPDPQRLIDELRRILKPGGKLIISASAVFSIHEGPHDYFHFTPFSFRQLFSNWSRIEMLRGSSQPFETIAILIQRIMIQCEVSPLARRLIELTYPLFPLLDRLIVRQYDKAGGRSPEREIDSMLPSNMQAVVIK